MDISRRQLLAAAAVLIGLYMEARRRLLVYAEKKGGRLGPRWMGLVAFKFVNMWSELLGITVASEENIPQCNPSHKYMIVWHPHGFLAWSAMFLVSRMAVIGHPHGQEWHAMVAPALFNLPIFSEVLMLVNARRVKKDVVENLLSKGKGIAIQPGGVREQMLTRHDQEQAFFPANLGFIKMALRHGVDLLPAYMFNENQMFNRVDGFEKASEWIYRKTGMGLPVVTGRWGVPMLGLMPKAVKIHIRWGTPIEVGEPVPEPTDEQVEALFTRYVTELRQIFNDHAKDVLPPEVAAKGLKIVRLDGKPVPGEGAALPTSSGSRL